MPRNYYVWASLCSVRQGMYALTRTDMHLRLCISAMRCKNAHHRCAHLHNKTNEWMRARSASELLTLPEMYGVHWYHHLHLRRRRNGASRKMGSLSSSSPSSAYDSVKENTNYNLSYDIYSYFFLLPSSVCLSHVGSRSANVEQFPFS